jgi:outer membrane receptor protein involved in Fe transport
LRYAVNPHLALRAAAYTAFRAPTLDNLYRAFSVPSGIFQANPALTPERLKGGEAGFDITTGRLRLQATAYYNRIEDLITSRNLDFSELPPGFFFGSRNINAGQAKSQGAELEADWRFDAHWQGALSYTYADSEITENDLDPASVGKQIGGVPRNRASLSITYRSPMGWRITPQLRWLQSSYGDNDHTLGVDEQLITDLSGAYALNDRTEFFVNIENLFDRRYIADNSGFNPPLRGTPLSAVAGVRLRFD